MRRWKGMKQNRGFSLVEMIMAVAVLSLLGMLVIQVFLASGSLNDKAADTDRAVAAVTDQVERLKSMAPGSELTAETLKALVENGLVESPQPGVLSLTLLYDADWKPLALTSSQSFAYTLHGVLRPDDQDGERLVMAAFTVKREDRYFHSGTDAPELFALEVLLPLKLEGGNP